MVSLAPVGTGMAATIWPGMTSSGWLRTFWVVAAAQSTESARVSRLSPPG